VAVEVGEAVVEVDRHPPPKKKAVEGWRVERAASVSGMSVTDGVGVVTSGGAALDSCGGEGIAAHGEDAALAELSASVGVCPSGGGCPERIGGCSSCEVV